VIDDCSQCGYIVVIVLFESIPVWFFAVEEISCVLAPDHKSIDGRVLILKAECARYDIQFMLIEGTEEFLLGSNPEVVRSLQMVDPLSNAVFVESATETLFVEVVPSVVDDRLGAMIIKVLKGRRRRTCLESRPHRFRKPVDEQSTGPRAMTRLQGGLRVRHAVLR